MFLGFAMPVRSPTIRPLNQGTQPISSGSIQRHVPPMPIPDTATKRPSIIRAPISKPSEIGSTKIRVPAAAAAKTIQETVIEPDDPNDDIMELASLRILARETCISAIFEDPIEEPKMFPFEAGNYETDSLLQLLELERKHKADIAMLNLQLEDCKDEQSMETLMQEYRRIASNHF